MRKGNINKLDKSRLRTRLAEVEAAFNDIQKNIVEKEKTFRAEEATAKEELTRLQGEYRLLNALLA